MATTTMVEFAAECFVDYCPFGAHWSFAESLLSEFCDDCVECSDWDGALAYASCLVRVCECSDRHFSSLCRLLASVDVVVTVR